ncbi:Disco-interacting protein 2 C [Liparis tanakae]|uniref:Disco-interacting protein 2 C n=1 Tax=Liparis tanakae TaxID=230148 RepID=A0A4Z2ERR2_9TELE|nr:Disco-interacting protein 2 C [Liparis tanakae]
MFLGLKCVNAAHHRSPSSPSDLQVALVFPNNDPASFMTAFYGCLLAEVVPVPIEVPLSRKDAGSQQIGFLLGSCGVTVALTSDACHKGLPKSPTGEIPQFKGWPKVLWFVTESKHLSKPPRDWFPHIKDANQDTAYIESVMNMMHVISIPYALMKVNPLSWIQKVCQHKGKQTNTQYWGGGIEIASFSMKNKSEISPFVCVCVCVCVCVAKVACVKSRDMHWALVAHREQRDVNLSSLRMLVVADGSNPCEQNKHTLSL